MIENRLHIAHFTNTYLPVMSGVVRSISTFRQAQVALGHNVFIFAQDSSKYTDTEPFVFRYPAFNVPVRNYPLTIPVSPLIDWVLPILKPDVIHAHHPAPMGSAASDKAEKLNIPLVFTHHTRYQEYTQHMGLPEDLVNDVLTYLLADYMKKCQHIIAPSSSIKQMISDTYGIHDRVTVIPTGIDLEPYQTADGTAVRQQLGWQDDEKILVSVGRLVDEKNFTTLVRAAAIAMETHDNVRLALIGDGQQRKHLEKLAQELGIGERVQFLGRVEYDKMPATLSAADIFCFASVTETQGLVTMEAMAAGLPVAAVAATGTSDIVVHGENGLLTDNNPEALAQALDKMLADPDLCDRLTEAASETAVSFDMITTAQRLDKVYEQAIEDKKAGRYIEADKQKPIFKIEWDRFWDNFSAIS